MFTFTHAIKKPLGIVPKHISYDKLYQAIITLNHDYIKSNHCSYSVAQPPDYKCGMSFVITYAKQNPSVISGEYMGPNHPIYWSGYSLCR